MPPRPALHVLTRDGVQVKSTRVYLHDSTLVTPYPLLLFGGALSVTHAERRASVRGLGAEFVIAPRTAVVFKELRRHMDRVLTALVGRGVRGAARADGQLGGAEGELIALIIHLLSTEFAP